MQGRLGLCFAYVLERLLQPGLKEKKKEREKKNREGQRRTQVRWLVEMQQAESK